MPLIRIDHPDGEPTFQTMDGVEISAAELPPGAAEDAIPLERMIRGSAVVPGVDLDPSTGLPIAGPKERSVQPGRLRTRAQEVMAQWPGPVKDPLAAFPTTPKYPQPSPPSRPYDPKDMASIKEWEAWRQRGEAATAGEAAIRNYVVSGGVDRSGEAVPEKVPEPLPVGAAGGASLRVGMPGSFKQAERFLTDREKAQLRLIEHGSTAMGDVAKAQAAEAERMAPYELQAARERTAAAKKYSAALDSQAAMGEILNKHYADLDRMGSEAAKMTVDPSRFWANRSTGDKVIAGLSMLLGAAGARPGIENPAMATLKQAIADDVNAQMVNMEQMNKSITQKHYLIQNIREKYKDDTQRAQALNVAALALTEATLKEMAAGGNERVQANAAQAQAVIDQWKLGAEQKLADSLAGEWVRLATAKGNVGLQVQGMNMPKAARPLPLVPGLITTDIGKMIASYDDMSQMSRDFKDLDFNAVWKKWFPGTDAQNYDARRDAVGLFFAFALSGMQLPPEQAKQIIHLFATPGSFKGTERAKSQALLGVVQSKIDNIVRAQGMSGRDISGFQAEGWGLPKATVRNQPGFKKGP